MFVGCYILILTKYALHSMMPLRSAYPDNYYASFRFLYLSFSLSCYGLWSPTNKCRSEYSSSLESFLTSLVKMSLLCSDFQQRKTNPLKTFMELFAGRNNVAVWKPSFCWTLYGAYLVAFFICLLIFPIKSDTEFWQCLITFRIVLNTRTVSWWLLHN